MQYFKGAYGNTLLREQILGPERFDRAFRKYVRDWAYKHPRPVRLLPRDGIAKAAKTSSYFWRGWYMHNWTLDLAVGLRRLHRATIPPAALSSPSPIAGPLVLPATLEVAYTDGSKERIRIPAEAWLNKTTASFRFAGR